MTTCYDCDCRECESCGTPIPWSDSDRQLAEIEAEINRIVTRLYGVPEPVEVETGRFCKSCEGIATRTRHAFTSTPAVTPTKLTGPQPDHWQQAEMHRLSFVGLHPRLRQIKGGITEVAVPEKERDAADYITWGTTYEGKRLDDAISKHGHLWYGIAEGWKPNRSSFTTNGQTYWRGQPGWDGVIEAGRGSELTCSKDGVWRWASGMQRRALIRSAS